MPKALFLYNDVLYSHKCILNMTSALCQRMHEFNRKKHTTVVALNILCEKVKYA